MLDYGETFVERGGKEAARTVRAATEAAMAPAAKIWDNLNRRDPQTGAPEGAVAIMKERMFRMFALRTRKIFSRPYGRRLQYAY